jgi:uncharacterized membrane protein YhaH (DUF805 family)
MLAGVGPLGAGASMRGYLRKWFSFHGRIGRRRYWILTLLYLLSWFVGAAILITLAALNYNPPEDTVTNVTIVGFILLGIATTVFVAVIVAGFASTGIRRLHDRGKTGYWLLLYYLLPLIMMKNTGLDTVGLIFWIVILGILTWVIVDLGALRGEASSNVFGPDPLVENPKPQPAD